MGYLKTIGVILIVALLFICIGQLTIDQPRADGGGVTGGTEGAQPSVNPPINPPTGAYSSEEFTGKSSSGGQPLPNLNNGLYGLQGETTTTGSLTWDFSLLLVSFIILTSSFFFLFQSKAMVKWIFRGEEGAPNPYAGLFMSSVVSILIIIIWVFRTMLVMTEPFENFVVEMFYNPREFTPGILIAAILPATVGLLKFITIVPAYQRKATDGRGYQRSYFVLLVYVAFNVIIVVAIIILSTVFFPSASWFNVISIAASIVTLIQLVKR